MLRRELQSYGGGLADKPEIVGLTKLDATPGDYADELATALRHAGAEDVMALSAVTGRGVTNMLRQLMAFIESSRAKEVEPEEAEPWSP
jgi:GTP-binding protein